jgi:hypothetical protein
MTDSRHDVALECAVLLEFYDSAVVGWDVTEDDTPGK